MKLAVTVHSNSKNPCVKRGSKSLHVYVVEKPIKGWANKAVITALAEFFKIKKNNILILKGKKSKNKLIEIN
jgi:uncharacterized protein YggU (UPF0235/DUF167 family)